MKIISLNLAGRKADIDARIDKIADFLSEEKADIVCLQEVTFDHASLAKRINDLIPNKYNHVIADLAERFTDKHNKSQSDGLAILTSIQITEHRCLTLQKVPADERGRPDFHKRIVQVLELSDGSKIANLHLASNQNSFLQLRELLAKLSKDFIIAGDFNMHKSKILAEKPYWEGAYNCSIEFKDYISFPRENCTFDYILLPHQKQFSKVETVKNLSDHSTVVCICE